MAPRSPELTGMHADVTTRGLVLFQPMTLNLTWYSNHHAIVITQFKSIPFHLILNYNTHN